MGYILKEKEAEYIRSKYKSFYFQEQLGISKVYVSLILHRKRTIPKRTAYCFCKAIDSEAEIEDYFEVV